MYTPVHLNLLTHTDRIMVSSTSKLAPYRPPSVYTSTPMSLFTFSFLRPGLTNPDRFAQHDISLQAPNKINFTIKTAQKTYTNAKNQLIAYKRRALMASNSFCKQACFQLKQEGGIHNDLLKSVVNLLTDSALKGQKSYRWNLRGTPTGWGSLRVTLRN